MSRVYRLWRREGLKVPQKRKKRRAIKVARMVVTLGQHDTVSIYGAGTLYLIARPTEAL
jgi:hypothetical protein